MAKSIRSGGVDFDDLFDPDVQGDGPSATFLTSGGVALRYAALTYGTKRPDVGYRNNADVDVSNLWAAKGTAVYSLPINGQLFDITNVTPNGQQGSAAITFYIRPDGTYELRYSRSHGVTWPSATGTWMPTGASASEFEVRFTHTRTGGNAVAGVTNGAATFASCSAERSINLVVGPNGHASGSRESQDTVVVEIRRVSSGSVVSTTTFYTQIETDGSI